MKISKHILLSLIAMPLITIACDPREPHCGMVHITERVNPALIKQEQARIKKTKEIEEEIAPLYPLVEQERAIQQKYAQSGYPTKDFKNYNAQLDKITSQLAYKKQLIDFNRAVLKKMNGFNSSLASTPGHKTIPHLHAQVKKLNKKIATIHAEILNMVDKLANGILEDKIQLLGNVLAHEQQCLQSLQEHASKSPELQSIILHSDMNDGQFPGCPMCG